MQFDWPLVRLGDHVDACLGKMLDAKKNKGELQPYLGNVNVRWGAFDLSDLSEMRFESHEDERYGLLPGDLVVCEGGEPGRCAIWTGPVQQMKIQKALHRIRPKASLHNYYLYYWFRHAANVGLLEPHFTGTTIKHLTGKAISALAVPLPPVETQRAMVEVLRQLDDRIDLLRQTNATLESIAQALFKSWFIDFDPVRAKAEGREPLGLDAATAALFPAEFEESVRGALPRGWRVGSILEVASLLSGGTPKTDNPDFWGGGIPWASAKDVSQCRDGVLVGTERTISQAGLERSSTRIIPALASVIVARGATTGRMVMFADAMAMNQTCYALISKGGVPCALNLLLRNEVSGLVNAAHGSVFDTITTTTFSNSQCILPPAAVLDRFEVLVRPLVDRQISSVRSAQALAAIRDTLLPRLISGKLRLPEAQAMMESTP